MKTWRWIVVLVALSVPVVGSAQGAPVRWEYGQLTAASTNNVPLRWTTASKDTVLATTEQITAQGDADSLLFKFFDLLGSQGWELIQSTRSRSALPIFLFKRRK